MVGQDSNGGEGLLNPAAQDDTRPCFSAPVPVFPDPGCTVPRSGPGAISGESDGQAVPTPELESAPAPRYSRRGRPKGSKNKSQEWLSDERIEQLRAAGRVRGEQLKRDRDHQRKAGLARAAKGDMGEIGNKGRAVQAANRQAQAQQDESGGGAGSNTSIRPRSTRSGTGPKPTKAKVEPGQPIERRKRGRPKQDPTTRPPAPPKEKKPPLPKEKKPPLTKEQLSERGRKGLATALARHPDLYERAGAGGLRAQQAAKERKRLEAEQARANHSEHGEVQGQDSKPPAQTEPPRPKRRYKTKWER